MSNQLQFGEIRNLYDSNTYTGLLIMRSDSEDQPWVLPRSLEASWAFLEEGLCGELEQGQFTIDHGVVNGWAVYNVISLNPAESVVYLALDDGEIYDPREIIDDLEVAVQEKNW